MIKIRKDVFRLLVVLALVACYVIFFTVPYLQTFGQGYTFQNGFYGATHFTNLIPDYPDHYLTLGGTVLNNSLGIRGNPPCISNTICRVPLTEQNFDNLFSGGFWTHDDRKGNDIDAKWLRENTKTAWLGFSFNWDYKVFFLQYILKLNNGDVVVCGSSPLFHKDTNGFSLGSADYYSPRGNVLDFYLHIRK